MNQTAAASMTNAAPLVTVGANFVGSNRAISLGFFPPDTDGAVGPDHFVELLNGRYAVYDKSGTVLKQSSLDQFWSSAGVAPQRFSFDPRVLYDPSSGRWFAIAADNSFNPNNILIAVSNTSDPTQGWQALAIPSDPTGQRWADSPTLGINQDAVYVSANMFPVASGGVQTEQIVLPKSDLLQPTPTAANATVFPDIGSGLFSDTPAVGFGFSGSEIFMSAQFGQLRITSIDGPPTSPSLDTSDRLISVTPQSGPPPAIQEGTDVRIATDDFRFSSDPVFQDGKLFAVQGIEQNGRPALRWFEIGDPLSSPVVLDSGILNPTDLDVYYGSIAINPLGQAVIGFTASGSNDFASAYAVAGTLVGDQLEFGDPILLKAGVSSYQVVDPTNGRNRWGDYSTTTYDPNDPSHFWTIQEWASAQTIWSTEISEIIFAPPAPIVQTWFGGTGNFSDPQNWSPPGSPAATDTLIIDAGRVKAADLTISNPNIYLGSSTSTPTLVLRDATLASTNTIRVETTTFDTSQPDLSARIRIVGSVTEDGAIDVGTTGVDVSQLFPAHLTISMAKSSTFTMDPGSIWFSSDGSTVDVNTPDRAALFVNNGEIEAFGGTVRMNVPVTGQGTFDVLFNNDNIRAGTLEFTKSVDAGETINLTAGLLKLDAPRKFFGSIQGFNPDSVIELADTEITSADYSNGILTLFDDHRVEARLDIVGDFTTDQFAITNQGGNAFITLAPSASVSAEGVNSTDGLKLDTQVAQLVQAMAAHSASDPGFAPTAMSTQTERDSTLQSALAPAWHS
jgi:hypothetical protein